MIIVTIQKGKNRWLYAVLSSRAEAEEWKKALPTEARAEIEEVPMLLFPTGIGRWSQG